MQKNETSLGVSICLSLYYKIYSKIVIRNRITITIYNDYNVIEISLYH